MKFGQQAGNKMCRIFSVKHIFYRLETEFFGSRPFSDFRKTEISQDQKFLGSSNIPSLEYTKAFNRKVF